MSLRELWSRLVRHRGLILGVTAAVVLATAVWTFLATPRYRSTAVVRILEQQSGMDLLEGVGSVPGIDLGSLGQDDLNTEIGVLRSRGIHEAVVDSLGLRVRLTRPAGERTRLLRVLSPGPPELEGTVTLRREDDGGYRVEVDDFDVPMRPSGTVALGETFRVGPLVLELTGGEGVEEPDRIDLEVVPRYRAVEDLRDEVRIQRQEGGSRLVEVSWDHPDRHLTAAVVNGIVEKYLRQKRLAETGETRSTAEALREEVADYEARLSAAEDELREFQQRNRVLAPEEEATQQVRRLAELQMAVDELRVERSAVADLLTLVEQRSEGEAGPSAFRQLATLPSLISNGAIQDMLETLVDLENQRSALSVRRQPSNEDVRQLDERIREIEAQLHRLASSYRETLDRQLASTRQELEGVAVELEAMPALGMEYHRRLRERRLLGETYALLQARLNEAEVREAIHDTGVRVVDAGRVPHPDDPVFPKPAVHLVLALLLGLTAATGGALTRDLWDDRVYSREDLRVAAPEAEVIASLPRLARADRVHESGRHAIDRDPWSPTAQAYRGFATSLAFSNGAEPPRVLVVTSPQAGDGKTTVASHLAVALARQGFRTVLVDGDLRAGGAHRLMGLDPAPGVAEVLAGGTSLSEAVRSVELTGSARGLSFLGAGTPLTEPLDLEGIEAVERMLETLRDRYDRVVVDAPAVERGGEALALGRRADATILVARRGRTERHAFENAAEKIRSARGGGAPVLVVNEAANRDRSV